MVVITPSDPSGSAGCLFALKLIELGAFIYIWPYEVIDSWRRFNYLFCISEMFLSLSFFLLLLDCALYDGEDSSHLAHAYLTFGIIAAVVGPAATIGIKCARGCHARFVAPDTGAGHCDIPEIHVNLGADEGVDADSMVRTITHGSGALIKAATT